MPVLKEDLRHEDDRVRLAVVNLLVGRRALLPPLASELESLLTAKNDGVSRHAAFLLGKMGSAAAPRLLKPSGRSRAASIRSPRPWPRSAGRRLGCSRRRSRTRSLASDEGAALALGQIRPLAPGTVQKLAAGLDDPDRQVRAAFLTAIGSPRSASRRMRTGRACHAQRRIRGDSHPGHRHPLSVGTTR